ncbi:HotDog domain-containing protein [Chlamydoabsidia padenii]|nr:HotDog domain-containing protein [Chlamydoabsidia padenii]
MNSTIMQSLAVNIRRRSRQLITTKFLTQQKQWFTTPASPPHQRRMLGFHPLLTSTVSFIVAAGVTYTVMAAERHEALLEQKHVLTGMDQDHVTVATVERDNLALVKAARADPDLTEFVPYDHLKGSALLNNFTASTLRAKGRIVVPPVVFYNQDRTQVTVVVHLGKELCGHDGIVHGGMLATLLDEVLALVAIPALPNHIGFTANLNIDYRRPVKSDQWLVMRGKLDRSEGRKAFVEAWIESLDGATKFVEAKSLYIAPKSPLARIL